MTKDDAEGFAFWLEHSLGLAPATRAGTIKKVKQIFNLGVKRGLIKVSPSKTSKPGAWRPRISLTSTAKPSCVLWRFAIVPSFEQSWPFVLLAVYDAQAKLQTWKHPTSTCKPVGFASGSIRPRKDTCRYFPNCDRISLTITTPTENALSGDSPRPTAT